jgi:hypothetical protein
MTGFQSQVRHVLVPHDGKVLITEKPPYTEQEIFEDREVIVRRLDAAYLNLLDDMEEFQHSWNQNWKLAIATAWEEGRYAGLKEWASDQGDLFKAETWTNLGDKAKEWAGSICDRMAHDTVDRYRDFVANYTVIADNPDGTILNWAWYKTHIAEAAEGFVEDKVREVKASMRRIEQLVADTTDAAKKVEMIIRYRQQIYAVPELIAKGDGEAVMAFLRGPLKDIDPELAENILNNPELPAAVAVIQDHDSVLTYLAYVSLMIDAVPPNFYVYAAGKGATYVVLELMLNIVLGLLTEGAFVAARVATLLARFAATSARVAGVARKIQKAEAAFAAYRRFLNDSVEACRDIRALGHKLLPTRGKGTVVRAQTKETVTLRKENMRRDLRCKCCGSPNHRSPRNAGNSVLVYR